MPLITELNPTDPNAEEKPLITEVKTNRSPVKQPDKPFLPWLSEPDEKEPEPKKPLIQAVEPAAPAVAKGPTYPPYMKDKMAQATADFIAADAFIAAKPGFIFKVGAQGLGYYRDGSKASKDTAAPAAKPEPAAKKVAAAAPAPAPKPVAQKPTLSYEISREGENLTVHISLPGRHNSKGVVLAVMGTAVYSDLTLRVEGFEELRARLPAVVDQKNVKAKFSKASQKLRVKLVVVDESAKASAPKKVRRKKAAAPPLAAGVREGIKPKVNIDDLKICSQCGGLGQYTDAQDIKCGLQGQRNSGLQRVLTYECPLCEGEGYVNPKLKKNTFSKPLTSFEKLSQAEADGLTGEKKTADAVGGVAKWADVQAAAAGGKGAVSPDKDWEMVTSPKDSLLSDHLLSDQHSMSADDRTKYAEFKKKMDPEKRAEFDRLIAEARDTPARDSHLPDMTNLKAEMSDFEGK